MSDILAKQCRKILFLSDVECKCWKYSTICVQLMIGRYQSLNVRQVEAKIEPNVGRSLKNDWTAYTSLWLALCQLASFRSCRLASQSGRLSQGEGRISLKVVEIWDSRAPIEAHNRFDWLIETGSIPIYVFVPCSSYSPQYLYMVYDHQCIMCDGTVPKCVQKVSIPRSTSRT